MSIGVNRSKTDDSIGLYSAIVLYCIPSLFNAVKHFAQSTKDTEYGFLFRLSHQLLSFLNLQF